MRNALAILCIYFAFIQPLAAQTNSEYYIKGEIKPKPSDTNWVQQVYLLKIGNLREFWAASASMIVDSAEIDGKGNFRFTNASVVDSNTFYRLHVLSMASKQAGLQVELNMVGTSQNFAYVFLNPSSQIEVQSELAHFGHAFKFLHADNTNRLLRKIADANKARNEQFDILSPLLTLLRSDTSISTDSINEVRNAMVNLMQEEALEMKKTAESSTDPYVSLFAAGNYNLSSDSTFALKMLSRYQQQLPRAAYTRQYKDMIEDIFYTLPKGRPAPEIVLPDVSGGSQALAELHGKYVLIDFWASWCKPCRQENKETVKPLYEKFKSKGFEVLSVSVDTDQEKWERAIEKDQLSWLQVSDLRGFESPVVKRYRVNGVPTTYVVDPQGNIIGKNLHGPELIDLINRTLQ